MKLRVNSLELFYYK